jgi:hypothetical protein
MLTEKYTIVIGVNAGYTGVNKETQAAKIVAAKWQTVAKNVFELVGIYVSASVKDLLTVYNTDWGCPIGGEACAEITCTRNPAFCDSADAYKSALMSVVNTLKLELKQSTVTVECGGSELEYLN